MPGPIAPEIPKPRPPRAPSKHRAPEGKGAKDPLKEKTTRTPETSGGAKDSQSAENSVDQQTVKDAGETAEQAVDTASKGDPNIAREALFQTASLGNTQIINSEISSLLKKKETQGQLTKAEVKKVRVLEKQLKKAQEAEAQVRARAERLQTEGSTPEAKALGFDLSVGLEQRSIAELSAHVDTIRAKSQAKDLDPAERASIEEGAKAIEEAIQAKHERIKILRKDRKAIGEEIPNQLIEATELILGKKLDPNQTENPLATMEETLRTIISSENPAFHEAFSGALKKSGIITSQEQWKQLSGLMGGEHLKDKDVDLKHLAIKAGGGLLMMILIMIYVASKGSVGGGGGHPGMG